MFHGSIPALITPFRDGGVDEASFQEFVSWQIASGSSGLVPCGTTGESPTLSHDEHRRVTELCIEAAGGQVPVIAGCGSNSTEEACGLVLHAAKAGADAALVVTPYYNKPDQEGLYLHFEKVAQAADLPVIIYNIPGRSVVDMSVETMGRLAKLTNIVGVKDATGDLARVALQAEACGSDFCQLSGNDDMTLGFIALGGVGCISVTANVAPKECAAFHAALAAGDLAGAKDWNDRLNPLHASLFGSPSPGPAKYCLSQLRGMSPDLRLPLTPPLAELRATLDAAMAHVGLEVG